MAPAPLQLPAGVFDGLPTNVSLYLTYGDIGDPIERKTTGMSIYESQIDRLFDGKRELAKEVRASPIGNAQPDEKRCKQKPKREEVRRRRCHRERDKGDDRRGKTKRDWRRATDDYRS